MRTIALLFTLILLPVAHAKSKDKTREPNSISGVACFAVRSLEVSKGRFLLNSDFELTYSTPVGLSLGLQILTSALETNATNDLCVSADQDSINEKKVRADWPYLAVKPRR